MGRHRTPLRYPGGKQRLTPFIKEILECNGAIGGTYAEPYAGGAGVAIELLTEKKVRKIYLNDSSRHIYAFWHSLKFEADRLCRLIERASLSIAEWRRHREIVRHPNDHDLMTLGFSTFYLNRCNRSGVLTAGVIGGKAQTGRWRIDARFPRNELIGRIETIATRADDIIVTNLDAEDFILRRVNELPDDTFVYCDPPYYERAARLYLNAYQPDDHVRVAKLIQSKLRQRWIVSYDAHAEIQRLYRKRRKFLYSIQYTAMGITEGREIFIFSDRLSIPKTSTLPFLSSAIAGAGRRVRPLKARNAASSSW